MENIEINYDISSANSLVLNSKFDSIDDYSRCFLYRNSISIFQFNARSIADLDRFENLKFSVTKFPHPPDVIVIGETWVSRNYSELYNIDGYEATFSCRNTNRGGGLAMYVSKQLNYTLTNSNEFEIRFQLMYLD